MIRGLFSKSLSLKVSITVIAVLTVLGGGSFIYIYNKIQNQLIDAQEREALTLASTLNSSLSAMMLKGGGLNPEEIQTIFIALSERKEVKNAVVYSHNGRRAFTNRESERNTIINRDKEEECLVCHRLSPDKMPLTQFIDVPGQGRVLRAVAPILKKESCLQCHFMGSNTGFVLPNEKYRGMVLVDMETKEMESQMFAILLAGIATYLAIILAVYFVLKRLVTRPIEIINTTMKEIEKGDLTRGITIVTRDEVGGLAEAINRVINTLSGIISRSKVAAMNVSMASEQILMKSKRMTEGAKTQVEAVEKTSSSIQELNSSIKEITGSSSILSTSAEETSSSVLEIVSSIEEVAHNTSGLSNTISETTASLEQIGSSVKEVARSAEVLEEAIAETGAAAVEIDAAIRTVADNAKESARLADKVVTDASEQGMISVVNAIDGMDKIRDTVKKAGTSVNHLSERSQEISKIVTVIDDITARTNLLALNAAILAAQAGEHGKSFSVVAEEIRDLAEKTSTSTKEIAQLIKTIQQETQDTVDIMREGLVRVDDGSKLVHTAGDALREIIYSSQRSQNAAKGIEGAASEQAKGVRQVAESVERIRDMIGQIVNASRELRKGTDQIVKAMEVVDDVSKQVKKATAEQSKGSKQIGAVSEDTADKTQLIAKATEEQRVGTEIILKSIDEVKTVAMEGMDIASEIDLSMESLRKEAEGLKRELEIFRIK